MESSRIFAVAIRFRVKLKGELLQTYSKTHFLLNQICSEKDFFLLQKLLQFISCLDLHCYVNIARRIVCFMCEWKRARAVDDYGSKGKGSSPVISHCARGSWKVPEGRRGMAASMTLAGNTYVTGGRPILIIIRRRLTPLQVFCSRHSIFFETTDSTKVTLRDTMAAFSFTRPLLSYIRQVGC